MLKHVSSIIASQMKQLSGDKRQRLLISHWSNFVGADFAGNSYHHLCRIDKITFAKQSGDRTLTIIADSMVAPELEYQTNDILQRINEFLGESYITHIRIKQGFTSDKPIKILSPIKPNHLATEYTIEAENTSMGNSIRRLADALNHAQNKLPN